ncbi:MAG: hypothetical protein ABR987_07530 [Terracidiphilus sp.]|jgi:hypothetical protein
MNRVRRETARIFAIFVLALTVFSTFGKSQPPAPAATAQVPAGPVLVAKIAENLSSKNAKAGDLVTAKLVKPAKLPDGTEVPKGSMLIGKVAGSRSKKEGDGKSLLIFRFDQVEPKGGAPIPIQCLVTAIGPNLGPKSSIGYNSVMGRGGAGSTVGLDPTTGADKVGARDEDDIPRGSTLPGVALGRLTNPEWTSALRGVHTEIDLDPDVVIKVQLR